MAPLHSSTAVTSTPEVPNNSSPQVALQNGKRLRSPELTTTDAAVNGSGFVGRPQISCKNCQLTNALIWRSDPEGWPLCNACGLFFKLHSVVRPLSLRTDVIKKRKRAASRTSHTAVMVTSTKRQWKAPQDLPSPPSTC